MINGVIIAINAILVILVVFFMFVPSLSVQAKQWFKDHFLTCPPICFSRHISAIK
jgi:hypothetical protein